MGKKFNDLNIWKKGYELLLRIYKIGRQYPDFEKYALYSQTIRSANSVIANIAEAHGRYYFKDKIRILYIARAEATELQSHLSVAEGVKYIDIKSYEELLEEYEGLKMGINAYIKFLNNEQHIN